MLASKTTSRNQFMLIRYILKFLKKQKDKPLKKDLPFSKKWYHSNFLPVIFMELFQVSTAIN